MICTAVYWREIVIGSESFVCFSVECIESIAGCHASLEMFGEYNILIRLFVCFDRDIVSVMHAVLGAAHRISNVARW